MKSVNKTGRCLVVHEASKTGGVGSELAAEVQERCFLRLEAPVGRITGWDTPFGLAYEKFYLPDQLRIVSSVSSFARLLADFDILARLAAGLRYRDHALLIEMKNLCLLHAPKK